ncbi:hypothetical protein AKJ09_06618 [Labilithrix luteola]|uniref:Lipoprotein n=1 Tax=Labilithrix luteola TaxID=1391654 RepID=A0A0K1Q3K5_9BACT|nr:hypothetical protein [Labilithrix luteola]AKU99954.1 hypothetical protein AKJ09_06618 [Labilithrix luteola]
MKKTHLLVLATMTSLLGALAQGCAAPDEGDGADAFSSDSDLTKRTKPKAGMGAVYLEQPAWLDDGFKGQVVVRSGTTTAATLTPGARADLVPGNYAVDFRPLGLSGAFQAGLQSYGVYGHLWRQSGILEAGKVWTVKPAGLRIELDRPLVWSKNVTLATVSVPAPAVVTLGTSSGLTTQTPSLSSFDFDQFALSASEIAAGATHLDRILPAETYSISLGDGKKPVTLSEGNLTKLTQKTVTFAVDLDPIDPAFPNTTPECVTMEADSVKEPVRTLDRFNTAVLPETYPVVVKAYGLNVQSKVAGGVKHFPLNRLELDDVEVSGTGGTTTKVRGTALVQVKTNTSWTSLGCTSSFKTGTGIDLPDGTYRIISTATGPSGQVSNTEEVTFP